MPSAREVRARQNRQKERVAAARAERDRARRRRRRVGGTIVVVVIVVGISIGFITVGGNKSSDNPTVSTASTVTTAAVTRCVGLKDTLPPGSPAMPLTAGPAPTALATKDLKVGTGAVVPRNAKVSMNYVGVACSTGKIFDSSYSRKQVFPADLSSAGQLIAGWQLGIPGMRIGGVRLLSIPANLAYGAAGQGSIGPNEPLFFLVAAVKLG